VFLDTKNLRHQIKRKGRSAKFIARYIGPFPITKAKLETSTYTLQLPPEYKIHPTFHARLLKPAVDNDPELFPNREVTLPPPPIDVEDNQWEVQELRDHCKHRNQSQYLVLYEMPIRYIAVWLFGYNQRNSRAADNFSVSAIAAIAVSSEFTFNCLTKSIETLTHYLG
jgi:hypothetical protein